ncbi:shikimate dehydrogenase family protein [Cephaloticoccus capnophilus]|uniref:shikimate dehydrogenase family protein n=1 Tax=Cephaloticoccus capnophilus TaxID=1548208 RepID=UPI000A56FEB0|nr:shikimate dehydrogenase [Cephaloticoccus capnophilus]
MSHGITDTQRVLTLADLEQGDLSFAQTSLAVLGHPIAHSLSPQMHNGALAALAKEAPQLADWRYYAIDVPPADLPRALRLLRKRGFLGLNLTIPHKVLALAHVAEIDPAARVIGAVNTLRRLGGANDDQPAHAGGDQCDSLGDGWQGFNTDGYGLAAAVRETLGLDLSGQPVILLGAGGAARGAAVECLAQGCPSLWIANRTAANLETLLSELAPLADKSRRGEKNRLHGFSPARVPDDLPAHALVINATSAGLRESDPMPIDLPALPRPAGVYDMIYNPPETPLLHRARKLGLPRANGLSMLVHQGAKALEIWSGIAASRIAPLMQKSLTP